MKLGEASVKSIETSFLKVRGNCLEIQNKILQLSNISLISTEPVALKKFPTYSVFLVLAGIVLWKEKLALAICIIAVAAGWILYWYISRETAKSLNLLIIVTNSGNIFPIEFNDKKFMEKVVGVMKEIIRDPGHVRDITINVEECTFSDGSSVIDNLKGDFNLKGKV